MIFCNLLIIVLASELNGLGVTGRIITQPSNAVAEVGSQVIFNCTSDTTVQNWGFSMTREEYETNTGLLRIVAGCIVQTGFTSDYEVDRPGGTNNVCNLVIRTVSVQQAGVYTCSDDAPGPSAILTVIDRDASITVSTGSQPETVEGDTVSMSYTVRYNTSTASSKTPTIQPVLGWTDYDGNAVTSFSAEAANSVTSNISVKFGRQDLRQYTCHINYVIKPPSLATGQTFASNIPNSLPNQPTTSNINVLYYPIISSITKSDRISVCPGKTVVEFACHATANPEPTYSWVGQVSLNYSGETIEAALNGTYVYTCIASNFIRGSTHSDKMEAPIGVSSETNEACVDTSGTYVPGIKTMAITLGSLLALSLAVNIVFTFITFRNRSSQTNGSKGAETFNSEHQKDGVHNRNEAVETSFPTDYQELSQTRQQPTVYAQLEN